MKIDFDKYEDYLTPKVDKDLYVYGAQGQNIVDLLDRMCAMAGSLTKVNLILTLLQERLRHGYSIDDLDAFDCSGLFMKFAMDEGLFKYDMNANDIYNSIPQKISIAEVNRGDFVFDGSIKENPKTGKKEWSADHIGYAISATDIIEAKGSKYGVVLTKINERSWDKAARPNWWSNITPIPVPPEKPVLKRELYYEKIDGRIVIRGKDVEEAQRMLTDKGYNPGTIDGIYGKNTEIAVKNFQHDKNLREDGVIGKVTGMALGFIWEG